MVEKVILTKKGTIKTFSFLNKFIEADNIELF